MFAAMLRVEAGDVAEELFARGVQLDADAVDTRDHDVVEAALEAGLIDVVLILADADGFRVDLHQLGERVHEPASDGNRAAHGEVVCREFLARHFARGVNRRAAFVDHDDHGNRWQPEFLHERLGLAPAVPLPMAMASTL